MARQRRNVARLVLAVAALGFVGATAVAWASRPVYIECRPCATNQDCGQGSVCRDNGFCSSNPHVSCD